MTVGIAVMPFALLTANLLSVGFLALHPTAALADCTGTPTPNAPAPGTTVTCGSGTFNGTIGTWSGQHQGNIDNVDVDVAPDGAADAVVDGGSNSAIIFGDGGPSTINIGTVGNTTDSSGPLAIVTGNVNNPIMPIITNPGNNTIQFGSNYTLNIWANGRVVQLGNESRAEAINALGTDNTIVNHGLIQSVNGGGAAIWFQDDVTGGVNTIDNFGTISVGVDAGRSVIGSSSHEAGAGDVNFINRTGAVVQGDISFASGDDTLQFFPESTVTGNINGGGGTNHLELNGAVGSYDTLPGALTNFTTLTKIGDGRWDVTGTLTGFTAVTVVDGTLGLTGNNTGYAGSVLVESGGVLEARAQSLPTSPPNVGNITNDGVVRFNQPDDGAYVGQIVGSGALEKIGAGVTVLAPEAPGGNTYSGGTTILEGGIAIAADAALGAASGPLTFDGGFLRLDADLDLAATRAVTLETGGGTIDTQGFTSTLAQGMTGPGAFTKHGVGTLILSGGNVYGGGTTVAAGTLQAGAAGVFSAVSVHTILGGATLDLAGFDQTVAGVSNAGLILTNGAGPGTALTVNGDYAGVGGTIGLNTFLDDDASPSDRLVVDGGQATGSTSLVITNVGGAGALTTANGILVIDAVGGATTQAAVFSLGGPVVAGPYEYALYRGGLSGSLPQSWFLRSALDCTDPAYAESPECQPDPGPGPDPGPDPDPGPGPAPAPPPPPPHYRQEVSLYAAAPALASLYGRQLIGTFHERFGERHLPFAQGDADPEGFHNRAWGRVIGIGGHHDGHPLGIYGGSPEFDFTFAILQAGTDVYRRAYDNGQRDIAGVYLAVGRGSATVDHNLLENRFRGGRDSLDAFSVGGYWTRMGESDWYLDGVLQGTWYDIEMNAGRGLQPGKTGAFGFAASLEGGYPFELENGLRIEPQAQLVYQTIGISSFNDGAADVRYRDADSLAGRIGLRLSRSWTIDESSEDGAQRQFTLWGRADLWHEFLGTPVTEFSSAGGFLPFTTDFGESWVKLGIGGNYELDDNVVLYGNVNYDAALRGKSHAWEGKVGLKVLW